MTEILSKAFETPELASTNILSILTIWLSLVTAAEGHLWVRTREAAKRVTITVLVRTGRKTYTVEKVVETKDLTPAAKHLKRNASIHHY